MLMAGAGRLLGLRLMPGAQSDRAKRMATSTAAQSTGLVGVSGLCSMTVFGLVLVVIKPSVDGFEPALGYRELPASRFSNIKALVLFYGVC